MAETAGFTPAPVTTVTAQPPFSAGIHVVPSFDVIELLPPAAQELLRKLRQRRDDAHALCVPFADIQEANTAKVDAERALRRLVDHRSSGGYELPSIDSRVVSAEKHLAKVTDDLRRLNERSEARAAAWRSASGALQAVEVWLMDGRPHGTVLEAVEIEPPKLNKGEGIVDAIERLRRRGRELKATMHTIQSAPFPSSYCKQRMREQVEQLAQRGPVVSDVVEHDGRIAWPTQQVESTIYNAQAGAIAFAEVSDAVALFAWLHRDALVRRLDAEIDAESDDAAALSHEARQRAEAEVQGDLLAVERDEAAMVWRAQAEGLPVEHRAEISPLAILNLQLVAAPSGNGASSSWQHAFDVIGLRR